MRLRFGDCLFDSETRQLRRGTEPVHLAPREFRLLELLLERRPKAIPKEDLHRELWPDTHVSDASLTNLVARVREAIGDDARRPRLVRTVQRFGYAWSGSADEVVDELVDQKAPEREAPAVATVTQSPRPRRRFLLTLALVVAAGAGVGMIAWLRRPLAGVEIHSIVVLPMVNLSADPSQEYFADGMTEALTANLAKIGSLRVVSRTSAMHFKGSPEPLREIARKLGVEAAVEGSVVREGDRVRITAQLVDARADRHLWAETYDRQIGDALLIQSELAEAIAHAVAAKIAPAERRRLLHRQALDPEAQEAYLRARFFWNQRPIEGYDKCIRYYEQAIAKEPGYAPAHAGLAAAYAAFFNPAPRGERVARAKAAAEKALELDPENGEALAVRAVVEFFYDWDFASADRDFRASLAVEPNNAQTLHWLAITLAARGQGDAAIANAERGLALDPLSPQQNAGTAWIYELAHRYDAGLPLCRRALELDPRYALASNICAEILDAQGLPDEAFAQELVTRGIEGAPAEELDKERLAYSAQGAAVYRRRQFEARKIAGRRSENEDNGDHENAALAAAAAKLGDHDEAFSRLDSMIDQKSLWALLVGVDPAFEPLHTDPRFAKLLERIGLTPAPPHRPRRAG